MAVGLASNFVVRDELANAVYEEELTQFFDIFNAGTNGGVQLQLEGREGDYYKRRFFDQIPTSSNARRDTTSTAAQTDTAMTQDEIVAVKLSRKFVPYAQTLDAWEKIGMSNDEMNVHMAKAFADNTKYDILERVIIVLKNVLGQDPNTVYDYSATADMAHVALIRGLQLFGDQAGRIICWLGHSKPWFNLMEDSLTVAGGNVGPAVLYEASQPTMGRKFVQTDSSNFIVTGTPDDYLTFGLVKDACVVTISESRRFVSDLVTGAENLYLRFQGEYAFDIEVKGHAYNFGAGGANPTDVTLAGAGNWTREVAHLKNGPGIEVRTQ